MPASGVVPPTARGLAAAARRLRGGGLVAFPTETVYGLGADALSTEAVERLFAAKGRPADNPLIVHVADRRMLRRVVREIPPEAEALIARFWPGPLTVVLPKRPGVPASVTAGLSTVAVRMPANAIALELIRRTGRPLAAPSANRSGRPSPTRAAHVAKDFPGLLVLDGGPTAHGVESTVVGFAGRRPVVLRPGAVSLEALRVVVPGVRAGGGRRLGASSPGTRHPHYAPTRPLVLFPPSGRAAVLRAAAADPEALVLAPDGAFPELPASRVLSLGVTAEDVARNLYAALRTRRRGSSLLVLGLPARGIGRAVMDRLSRAASAAPRTKASRRGSPR